MTTLNYIIDSVLVLLVLLQIKEHPVTNVQLIRPFVVVAVAVVSYLHGVPSGGNDLVLVGALALLGALIGTMSGTTTHMRRGPSGETLLRTGPLGVFFWVLGMGSRFAFIIWFTHSGAADVTHFSATHSITSREAWTVALLAMAVCEVAGRTAVIAHRRYPIESAPAPAPTTAKP
jgi:hypothetical protein